MNSMARNPKLKVFRTPIGFHDAYVAAPSQKAALEAWGSDADLFGRGVAERVEDPELMREPLAKPGTVIRRLRGTPAEQLAALPPDVPRSGRAKKAADEDAASDGRASRKPPASQRLPKPKPRPDRRALDKAEQALAELETRHAVEREVLAKRQAELDRDKRALEARQETENAAAAGKVRKAGAAYERAMQAWRG